MASVSASPAPQISSVVKWLILIIASIGFAFDIYELLMLPLVLPPALREFSPFKPGTPEFRDWIAFWRALLFWVPAFVGGSFGLIGGYLTDRLGRRRVLTWSILIYAFSAFFAGFSTSPLMLLILRCTTFVGVCVEFVAAVAWLAELFPDPRERESVLGYTQAFSSVGGILVAVVNSLALSYSKSLPAVVVPEFLATGLGSIAPELQHEAWRYTLMSGLIPAIPLILIRPFLPESPVWKQKKSAGTLKRPSFREIFAPTYRRTTIVTTLMFACSYGAAFGAIQQIPQIVPGLASVAAETAGKPEPAKRIIEQETANDYTKMQEFGGLAGRFFLAFLAVRILSRRALLRVFQVPGLILVPLLFACFLTIPNKEYFVVDLSPLRMGKLPVTTLSIGLLMAGFFTVAQFSFWGNYLPRVYPVHLRGTGESFAANIGGRMIGTSFAAVTSYLATQSFIPGESDYMKMTYAAAGVALFVYLVGSLACFFLPEPPHQDIAD